MKKTTAKKKRVALKKPTVKKIASKKKITLKKPAKKVVSKPKKVVAKAKPVKKSIVKEKPKTSTKAKVEIKPKKEAILLPSAYPEPVRKKIRLIPGKILTAAGWLNSLKE